MPAKRQLLARLLETSTPKQSKSQSLLAWVQQSRQIYDQAIRQLRLFGLHDYPWLTELYQTNAERIIVRKAAQVGVTEYLVSLALYATAELGATVFYALPPGKSVVSDFVHQRLDPALINTIDLAELERDTDNVGLKTFARGAIYIRGTNVPAGRPERAPQLSAVPADLAIVDEFDRVPPAAIPLIRERLLDSHLGWERLVSTPTYPGFGIDTEFQASDQHEAYVRCANCSRPPQRIDWDLVDEEAVLLRCRGCKSEIDMAVAWAEGLITWIAAHRSTTVGFWINRLLSPRIDLAATIAKKYSHDEMVVQSFWNADLGVAYEPKGAKLTATLLDACRSEYEFPDTATRCAMGVDVQGLELHCYVKQRQPEGKERAVWIGTVPDFADLDSLMKRYDVSICVIDAMPEMREARAFVQRWPGRAFLARFVPSPLPGNAIAQFDELTYLARIDRDQAIGTSHAKIEQRIDELPRNYTFIPGLVDQLTANVRVKTETALGQMRYTFPKTGRPDHFDLAKAYSEVAMIRLPMFDTSLATVEQPVSESRWTGYAPAGQGKSRWRRS